MIAHGALFRAADDAFEARDRQALADAGALVDALVLARQKCNLLDDFADVVGNIDAGRGRHRAPPRLPAR